MFHPQFGGLVQVTAEARPADDEQATALTIARMAQYAREDSTNPIVRRAAHAAIAAAPGQPETTAVWNWVHRHVRFQEDAELARPIVPDPEDAEVLVRPIDLLTMPAPSGDCDDFAMLTAAMLRALGIEAWYKTVAADPADPSRYSHVYVVARTAAGPVALDSSHGPYAGWEVQPLGKTRLWPVENNVKTLGDYMGPTTGQWTAPQTVDAGGSSGGAGSSLAIDLAKIGAQAFSNIAQARWGQPPAGTYIQQGNSVYYRQPTGNAGPFSFPGMQTGFSAGTLLVVAIVVIAGVGLLASASRRRD